MSRFSLMSHTRFSSWDSIFLVHFRSFTSTTAFSREVQMVVHVAAAGFLLFTKVQCSNLVVSNLVDHGFWEG
jgi:hypothetical protein